MGVCLGWRGAWPSEPRPGRLPRAITALGVPVALHAITDGRDVAPVLRPSSSWPLVQAALPTGASIATVIGRYWAMDRDNRWERVEPRLSSAMVQGQGRDRAATPQAAIAAVYAKGETDEFLAPTVIDDYHGRARTATGSSA